MFLPLGAAAKAARKKYQEPEPLGKKLGVGAGWKNSGAGASVQALSFNVNQCFGSGSGRIRIIGQDPDPYQETLIWIRVPKKIVINLHTNQPKL